MKLSFTTWAYGSFPIWLPSYPLKEVIKRLTKIGYDGIEIGAANPHAWPDHLTQKDRKEIKSFLKDNNLVVSSICPALGGGPGLNPASCSEPERKASIEYYKKCIDLAYDLGSKIVIWVAGWKIYGTSQKQAWEWTKEALKQCGEYARAQEIKIAIEPTPADSDIVETVENALQLMSETNLPNVKVMFDTSHVFYRNESMADCALKAGNNLLHVHISDTDRLPPGCGKADFRPLIDTLKKIGYNGFLTQEIGFSRSVDPDVYALQGYQFLKNLISS